MTSYIVRRLVLMIPTLIGVLTITFVISEFVPGGPADQIQAMLEGHAMMEGGAEVAAGGGGHRATRQRTDPKLEMRLRRLYGLHIPRWERYLRTLVWFSPDSILSSQEIDPDETAKFRHRSAVCILLRYGPADYVAFRNRWRDGEVVHDAEADEWKSVVTGERFDQTSGRLRDSDGEGGLEPIPLKVRSGGSRDEIYVNEPWRARVTNLDNWHGFFLLRFGTSIHRNKTVIELVKERLPISISLGVWSFLITYPVCILLGIAKAVRHGTRFDAVTSALVLIGYSIPGFVLAVLLIVLFGPGEGHVIELIPIAGLSSSGEPGYEQLSAAGRVLDYFHHLLAPVLCLSIGSFAVLTMLTKNSILEEIHQLYAVAARARGLSEGRVLGKHVFRNAMIPLVTGFPSSFLAMFFTGSLLIEQIFSLDGLGLLSYAAVMERDFPVIMGSLFIFTLLGLIGQLLTDISYVFVDPRIHFEGGV